MNCQITSQWKILFIYIYASYIFRRKMLYESRFFFMDHVEFCQLAVWISQISNKVQLKSNMLTDALLTR